MAGEGEIIGGRGGEGGYVRGKFLSRGAFGEAFVVTCRQTGRLFVVKLVDLTASQPKERDAARRECNVLAALRHPNIIEYRESFEEKGRLCIVMAFADGGDLTGRLKKQKGRLLEESQIADWFVQICLAMKHVHDRKILHRDLKSQNIFLSGRQSLIKLGDFGIARVLKNTNEHARTAIGTPYYLSPEICEGKPYNYKSDMWSLGIVLYEMCTLKCPFDASNLHGLVLKIIRGVYQPISPHFSPPLKALVASLLQKDPRKRPSINEVLALPYCVARISKFLDDNERRKEFGDPSVPSKPKQQAPDDNRNPTVPSSKPAPGAASPVDPPKPRSSAKPRPSASRLNDVSSAQSRLRPPVNMFAMPSLKPTRPDETRGAAAEAKQEPKNWDRMVRGGAVASKPPSAKAVGPGRAAGAGSPAGGGGGGGGIKGPLVSPMVKSERGTQKPSQVSIENEFLRLKRQAEIEQRAKEAEAKREAQRAEMIRVRDAIRRKQQEERKLGGSTPPPREAAGVSEENRPTGIHIYTKPSPPPPLPPAAPKDEIASEERRQIWQEQQEAAERNRRRIEGNPPQGRAETPVESGEERKAAVLARKELERQKQREEEEEALRRARVATFEERKMLMQKAQERFTDSPGKGGQGAEREEEEEEGKGGGEEEEERKEGEEVGKEVNPSQGDDVGHWSLTEEFNGSEVEVVSSEEAESEEEEEEEAEDEDYGAMIKEMTALLSKEDSPIKPVQVERSMRGNEEEEEEDDHEFHGEDEGSIHQRIEELRMLLEEKMGFERFFQAYQYMKEVKDDDEEGMVSDKITELMGEGFQELFPSLMQLLACEATTYGN